MTKVTDGVRLQPGIGAQCFGEPLIALALASSPPLAGSVANKALVASARTKAALFYSHAISVCRGEDLFALQFEIRAAAVPRHQIGGIEQSHKRRGVE